METAAAPTVDYLIDTDRYPLSNPGSPDWKNTVSWAREQLRAHGCCVLSNFIRNEHQNTLQQQCAGLESLAYYDTEEVNAYNISTDSELPNDHPGRRVMERGNAFVARDLIPQDFIISQLYTNEIFQNFVAACFGLPQVHELADPLAGLCLNVISAGKEHPWHFDTNEFTVSMLTQQSSEGGVFEYCPNIRSATTENFDDVREVIEGRATQLIKRLSLRPGDLQLFTGRFSLHRVSTVGGTTKRHSAIFAYSEHPGVVGTLARTRQLFGRVLPEHEAAAAHRARGDRLLD